MLFHGFTVGRYDLFEAILCYKESLPPNILPIGEDPGGDQLCLSISGDDEGCVYYWPHDSPLPGKAETWAAELEAAGIPTDGLNDDEVLRAWETDINHGGITGKRPGYYFLSLVSNSFDEFLRSLKPTPEDDG